MDLDTIDSILAKTNPASQEHWDQIARNAHQVYTTPLFAVSPSPDGEVLTLAGTGTLVTDGKAHYVLTAAHVWHDVLKRAEKVGISLRADLYSQCLIERTSIVPSGPAIPNSWRDWGPDIIFLRIPEVRVGEINAFRGFYGLHCEEQSLYRGEHTQAYLVAGTPAALGTYTQNRASVQVMGFWAVKPPTYQKHEGWDYFDAEARFRSPTDAQSFGGVSGGGLWKVQIYGDSSSDKIASTAILEGVAFYASKVSDGTGTIRCHGPKSIRRAMQEAPSGQDKA